MQRCLTESLDQTQKTRLDVPLRHIAKVSSDLVIPKIFSEIRSTGMIRVSDHESANHVLQLFGPIADMMCDSSSSKKLTSSSIMYVHTLCVITRDSQSTYWTFKDL